jgi:hypothetical protein
MAFQCPVCGDDHPTAVAVVQVRGARKLADLPPMTVAEFVAAYPTYSVDVNHARKPPAIHIAANGEPGQLIMATLEDERLHPGNYPVRLPDGTWVTVNGVFKLGRAVQDFERSRGTAAARFFVGRSTVGLDPLLIDALIRPASPVVADAVKARNAAFAAAQEAAKGSADPALTKAAREAEVEAMAPPFPVTEYEEIEWPAGEVLKVPVRFTFSDGTVRTAQDFADEENTVHRARLRL